MHDEDNKIYSSKELKVKGISTLDDKELIYYRKQLNEIIDKSLMKFLAIGGVSLGSFIYSISRYMNNKMDNLTQLSFILFLCTCPYVVYHYMYLIQNDENMDLVDDEIKKRKLEL